MKNELTNTNNRSKHGWILVTAVFLGGFGCAWGLAAWTGAGAGESKQPFGGPLLEAVHADLQEGVYQFFPNRRSLWVVNRSNGRMANYHVRDDSFGTVKRSRVAQLDLKAFPTADTMIQLTDRHLSSILWVCNVRTGDAQMWQVTREDILRPFRPLATSTDLMDRRPSR